MANLYPYIYSDDARRQAEYYVKALGGEIILLKTFAEMPQADDQTRERLKDKILHLRLRAAGQIIFMADSVREPVKRGNGMDLALEFADEQAARQAFAGLSAGGEVLMPFAKQFWGAMAGMVVDMFGVRWQITTESIAQ